MYVSTRSKPHEQIDVIGYLRGPAALTHQIVSWVEPRDKLNTWENRKIFCPCREKNDFNYLIRSLITDLLRSPCSLTRDNRCVSLVLTSSSHVKNIQTAETCKCKSEDQRGKVRINVIFRRVRVTIVAVEKQQYYIFWVCELSRWGGGKLLNIKCVLIFSTTVVRNISHFKKNWKKYDHISTLVFM